MKRVLLASLFFYMLLVSNLFSGQGSQFETIVDIDYSFFLSNPAMPWLNDPFKKSPGLASFPRREKTHHLQGIAFKGARSSAMIDGKSIRVGDSLGDRRVSEIGSNFVVLEKGNSQIQLILPPADPFDEDMKEESIK